MKLADKIKDLEKANDKLRRDNLMMRIHLELICEDVNSLAAKRLIALYRRAKRIRHERYIEGQN